MKRALAIIFPIFLTVSSLCAQEIVARLSSPTAQVGEPVQLVVTVRGSRNANVPQTLSVNGLHINLAGRSTQFEMRNFQMSSTLTYTYVVVPQFEGEFTIPPFQVTLDNKNYPTQAMRLMVSGSARSAQIPSLPQNSPPLPPGAPSSRPSQNGRPYFGELILSKKSVCVGEVVPIEIRFYFDAQIGGQVGERPNFSGEGFTVQKFSNAVKREQVLNEARYVVFSFQSAITAVKAGTLDIPTASLEARLQLPGKAPRGFDDFFGNLPQGIFNESQDVKVETAPQTLEVMALPKEDRPADFSGAVGKFTMEASVSPKKASGGEPVTLRVTVSGRGNFEGMGAPSLTDDEGWRTYPPSDKFHSTDAIGFTGEKTFEFPIIARQDQTRTPGIRFSYFDPSTGKYTTLTQEPLPVDAKAGATAATGVAAAQPKTGAATPAPTPASTPDITAMAGGSSSWSSLLYRKGFLISQALLAFAWLTLVTAFSARRFSASDAGRARARKKQAEHAYAGLRSTDSGSFYDGAIQVLALSLNVSGEQSALTERIESSNLPDDIQSSLKKLIERHAESKFAGSGAVEPTAQERESLLATLKDLLHEK